MQFLVINTRRTEGVSEAEFKAKVGGEVQRVRELYRDGFVRTIWHRGGDTPGGVIVIEAESEQEVRDKLATLPLVAAGIVEVSTVIQLKPFGGFAT